MKKEVFVVGISGGSGSGKTTFINRIEEQFSPAEVCIMSMDDYYRPREEQVVDENGIKNFDLPESIDSAAFYHDIQRLRAGQSFSRQEYTFNNADATPRMIEYRPAPVIIVEGLFIFHEAEIFDLLDLKILIDSDNVKKLIRRVKRDNTERNYPLDDVLYRYEHHVLPCYERYIKPYIRSLDVIINNNYNFEAGLDLVVGFLRDKIK